MSERCRYEREVLRAAAADRWTDALREHLSGCDDCVAAMSVAPWMERFARISDREHILPDPQLVWLKAQLIRTPADVARVSRPLNAVQMLAYLLVAAGWAGLLMAKWEAVERWIRGFTPAGMLETAARAQTLSLSVLALVFVLASATLMLGVHAILAEE
ncbi:MAG: hypothetical protein JO197_04665 [Acidobacteria bacterium]|nr:hypothetical protein [Acidobacteriota bacterium]MBV9475253.1 hypothetical protein [Acidobacteriota bacterium]